MKKLLETLFTLSDKFRYTAIYDHGELTLSSRAGIAGPSSFESAKVEELIVNPSLRTLVTQRGNIDCGGVRYMLVRFGTFYQIIIPICKKSYTLHVTRYELNVGTAQNQCRQALEC